MPSSWNKSYIFGLGCIAVGMVAYAPSAFAWCENENHSEEQECFGVKTGCMNEWTRTNYDPETGECDMVPTSVCPPCEESTPCEPRVEDSTRTCNGEEQQCRKTYTAKTEWVAPGQQCEYDLTEDTCAEPCPPPTPCEGYEERSQRVCAGEIQNCVKTYVPVEPNVAPGEECQFNLSSDNCADPCPEEPVECRDFTATYERLCNEAIETCTLTYTAVAPTAAEGENCNYDLTNSCEPCDRETPVCPECPETKVCEPFYNTYTRVMKSRGGQDTFVCVDTHTPVKGEIPKDEDCEYTVTTKCDLIKRYMGCFDPATKITMADKSTKAVLDLQNGDLVWNPLANKAAKVVKLVAGPEEKPMVEIGYDNQSIRVTSDHPMIVQTPIQRTSAVSAVRNSLVIAQAASVSENDMVLGAGGKYHQVSSVRTVSKPGQVVINLEIEGDSKGISQHAVVANGVVTGDLTIQNAVKKDNSH